METTQRLAHRQTNPPAVLPWSAPHRFAGRQQSSLECSRCYRTPATRFAGHGAGTPEPDPTLPSTVPHDDKFSDVRCLWLRLCSLGCLQKSNKNSMLTKNVTQAAVLMIISARPYLLPMRYMALLPHKPNNKNPLQSIYHTDISGVCE